MHFFMLSCIYLLFNRRFEGFWSSHFLVGNGGKEFKEFNSDSYHLKYSYFIARLQLTHWFFCFLPGPLTYKENGRSYLIGVVSFGEECADPEYPGVYARVTSVLDWIHKELRSSC